MAIGIIENKEGLKCLYCLETNKPFGFIMDDDNLENFIEYSGRNLIDMTDTEFLSAYEDWKFSIIEKRQTCIISSNLYCYLTQGLCDPTSKRCKYSK